MSDDGYISGSKVRGERGSSRPRRAEEAEEAEEDRSTPLWAQVGWGLLGLVVIRLVGMLLGF